jgi:hypothetical protein
MHRDDRTFFFLGILLHIRNKNDLTPVSRKLLLISIEEVFFFVALQLVG